MKNGIQGKQLHNYERNEMMFSEKLDKIVILILICHTTDIVMEVVVLTP